MKSLLCEWVKNDKNAPQRPLAAKQNPAEHLGKHPAAANNKQHGQQEEKLWPQKVKWRGWWEINNMLLKLKRAKFCFLCLRLPAANRHGLKLHQSINIYLPRQRKGIKPTKKQILKSDSYTSARHLRGHALCPSVNHGVVLCYVSLLPVCRPKESGQPEMGVRRGEAAVCM